MDRLSALVARAGALAWMYLLVPIPLVTDLIEIGSLPRSLREWTTEVVAGAVIAALVAKARRSQRMLESTLDVECARSRRTGAPLSVIYLDLDHFKQINDRLGHAAGDQILRQFAQAIREVIRLHVDSGFRLGGDEFAVVLPSSTANQAGEVLFRLTTYCARRDSLLAVGTVAFSVGIVEFDGVEDAAALLARGDKAMYQEKVSR